LNLGQRLFGGETRLIISAGEETQREKKGMQYPVKGGKVINNFSQTGGIEDSKKKQQSSDSAKEGGIERRKRTEGSESLQLKAGASTQLTTFRGKGGSG